MENLIDIRDELYVAKCFVASLAMACQSPSLGGDRSALCAVADSAREKLESVLAALDEVIAAKKS